MTLSRRLSPSLSLRRRLPAVLLAVLLSLALCALSTPSATVFVAAQAPPPCPTLECTGLPEPLCEVRQTGATPGLDGSTLTKFIDALPRPAVAQPVAPQGDAYGRPGPDSKRCDGDGGKPSDCPPQYHFILAQTSQQLHSELPYKTTVYGYSSGGGPVTYPGPTIEARSGSPIEVRWENRLPRCHLLPVDPTIADTDIQACEMLKTQSRGWYTSSNHLPAGQLLTGPMFSGDLYHYDNAQAATMLLYHDHALFMTRLNVQAGLAGLYMLRDRWEDKLNLPSGEFEVPLMIQDRSFNADGSLFYPSALETPPDGGCEPQPNPSIVPEFFGNTALVNGQVWPRLSVQPRQYRLRFLNGANARFFNLRLEACTCTMPATPSCTCAVDSTTAAGPTLLQIGSDQGFLSAATPVADRLLLGPAERADILVDFSAFAGRSLLLSNNAQAPFMTQVPIDPTDPAALREIMRFDVAHDCHSGQAYGYGAAGAGSGSGSSPAAAGAACSCPPAVVPTLPPFERLREADAKVTRIFRLDERTDAFGRLLLLINLTPFEGAVADHPKEGDVEIWGFENHTPDVHPMHIHLVRFQLVKRVQIAGEPTAEPFEPSVADEFGWKDTILAPPGLTTYVIARFDRPGPYVVHCHILEHEDHDMMRPFIVVGRPQCKNPHGR